MCFFGFQPHSHNAVKCGLWMFILQMFWCWWHQGWRQSLRVTSARRRMSLWLLATSLRLTPCLAPPVGWRGLNLASVWPVNCEGAPVADTSPPGPLCSRRGPRARQGPLTPWCWTRTAGTAECRRQRPGPQAQVGLMLLSRVVVKTDDQWKVHTCILQLQLGLNHFGENIYFSNFSRSGRKRGSPVLGTTEGRFPHQFKQADFSAEYQWRQPIKVSSLRLQLLPGAPEGATGTSQLQPPTQGRLLQVLWSPAGRKTKAGSKCWKKEDWYPCEKAFK